MASLVGVLEGGAAVAELFVFFGAVSGSSGRTSTGGLTDFIGEAFGLSLD